MLINEKRALELMEKTGIDTLVATTPENVAYASGFWSLSQWILKATAYAILPRDRRIEPIIVAPMSDIDLAVDMAPWATDIVPYGRYCFSFGERLSDNDSKLRELAMQKGIATAPLKALIKVLKEKNLDSGTIGIDERNMSCSSFEKIRRIMPRAQIKEAHDLFREIRMIKTKEEVGRLKKSVQITEKAMSTAVSIVEEGISEKEIAKKFERSLIENGAMPLLTCIGFDSRGAYPNVQPSERKLRQGDTIRFDIGCRYDCYCSDIARTFVLGRPSNKHMKYHEAIVEGETKALERVRPGAKASEVFNAAVDTVRKAGIPHYNRHHCGHGIGIEPYDPPMIGPTNEKPLQEGMILCIETPYMELGFTGLQVEDTVIVRKNGYDFLSTADRELRSI